MLAIRLLRVMKTASVIITSVFKIRDVGQTEENQTSKMLLFL